MKDQIRQTLKAKRASLPVDEFNQLSFSIAKTVLESEIFKESNRIGFYHSVRGEADPASLKTGNTDKTFFLPVLSKNPDKGLVFIQLNDDTEFENNKFSIPEPVYDENNIVAANTLDLVIVPLLSFDQMGSRLGMGGGFYDRAFAFKKLQTRKPILMGFAYDFQETKKLEPESWDVGLDMIATETRLIIPKRS